MASSFSLYFPLSALYVIILFHFECTIYSTSSLSLFQLFAEAVSYSDLRRHHLGSLENFKTKILNLVLFI